MLTVKLCELCPQLHRFSFVYEDYDVNLNIWRTMIECNNCNHWYRFNSIKQITVEDLINMGFNIKIKKEK